MFYGQYIHSIDSKGRLTIPSKFREAIRDNDIEKFFVTRGLGGHCLFVFAPREWKLILGKLREQPLMKERARDFMRLFIANATEVECDKQGRIMIPQVLLEWAGIRKDVVVAGVLDRLEIWDEQRWKTFESEKGNSYEEIAESLLEVKD